MADLLKSDSDVDHPEPAMASSTHKPQDPMTNVADEDENFINDSCEAILNERMLWGTWLMYSIIIFFIIAAIWAKMTILDEITIAQGKVIPSSQIQVIQNLEGGILAELYVKEGDHVKKGQVLLRIDDTRFSSSFKEGEQKYIALLASIARLRAESKGEAKIDFPEIVHQKAPELITNEQYLFDKQHEQLQSKLATLQRSYHLSLKELNMTKPLVNEGLISKVDLLRLEREVNELQGDMKKLNDEFHSNAQKELTQKEAEFGSLKESLKAAEDRLTRTTVRSPVNGTVNLINVSTIGAVIQPGISILEIVPTEDNLLIEAKIKPQDIAFIHPGQSALVKITAYDYTMYGGLTGKVEHISADTLEAQNRTRDESYYKVLIRTQANYLGHASHPLYIMPGMTVVADVMTGKKSVLDYLLNPILKARQTAFRER